MQILYDAKKDLLDLRLDDRKQQVVNKRVSDDICPTSPAPDFPSPPF